jgi:RNA polymerase sigma factor (sigma-70 family)
MIARSAKCVHTARVVSVDRYIRMIARRHARRLGDRCAITVDDLIAAGYEGALRASHKFDPSRGFKFITYAAFWINQSIDREVKNGARTIRVPVQVIARAARGQVDGNDALRTSRNGGVVSLDETLRSSRLTLHDLLSGQSIGVPAPDTVISDRQSYALMLKLIDSLDDPERRVFCRRYFDGATLAQVGQEMGFSAARAQQLALRAADRLRRQYQEIQHAD